MSSVFNRVKVKVSGTPGTGTVTLGIPYTNFQKFSSGGAVHGDSVEYTIEEGTKWEVGIGTYSNTGGVETLARTTVLETSNEDDSKPSFSSSATVFSAFSATLRDSLGVQGPTFGSRAEAIAATVPSVLLRISVIHVGVLLEYIRDASGTALTTDGGTANWSPSSVSCYLEHFGAVGDYYNDSIKGTDDTSAIVAAVAWLGVKRGGKITILRRYRTTSPIVLANRALEIEAIKWERAGAGVSVGSTGVIIGDFTDGPVIHINQSEISVKLTVLATALRTAATITTGYGNINCGILVEPTDVLNSIISDIDIDCLVRDQPADGIACEGPIVNVHFHDTVTTNNGRHGRSVTRGELSGRSNKARIGIINLGHGLSSDNKGHNIAVGHPNEGSNVPYRITVGELETYRGGYDPTVAYSAHSNYVRAEDFKSFATASTGGNASNVATHPCWYVDGRDITFEANRYILAAGDCVFEIGTNASLATRGVWIKGGKEVGSSSTNFLKVNSAASGIHMDMVDISVSAPIALPVTATNVKITTYNSETIYNRNDTRTATIASGEITVNGSGLYIIDTEAAAATDDLTNILNAKTGEIYYFRPASASRVITLKHASGGGNLRLHGLADYTFTSAQATVGFSYNGAQIVPLTPPASADTSFGLTASNLTDADSTFTPNTNRRYLRLPVPITANRTLTLSTTGAFQGMTVEVSRAVASTGAFTLNVGGLKSLNPGEWCVVKYITSAWVLWSYGTL